MCIEIGNMPQVVKNGKLKLWKVIRKDNKIGLWKDTGWHDVIDESGEYHVNINVAEAFITGFVYSESMSNPGQFHCFFTRKEARMYTNHRYSVCSMFLRVKSKRTKIIRVYADSSDVIRIGRDSSSGIPAISVSKMEIKSLKHQR